MEATVIPCIRGLNDYHAQVKEISAYADFHAGELRVNRKDLLNAVKLAQELRCFTSIRTCYFLKLTSSNVKDIAQLPFMKPNGYQISDRLVEMAGIGSVRSSINKFLKTVFANRFDLPGLLANFDFNSFPESVPYLPEGIKPGDFFACSTIPSLFGHFWTVELKKNFIDFIFEVGDKIQNLTPGAFRGHWLFDCIKYYVFSSEVSQFLRLSIGDIIFNIVRDQELVELSRERSSQKLFDKLCVYARQMLDNMKANISIFPNEVKHIMKHFVESASTPEDRLSWLELLFIDCVLAPAISNPRNCGIIPPTFYLDPSPFGPVRALNILAQILRFVLHPQQLEVRYQGINSANIAALPLADVLESIVAVDGNDLNIVGPKMVDLLPLLGIHYILLLLSLPDVYLLADVLQKVPNPDQYINKDAVNIPTNESVAFDFFRFDVWDFNAFGFKKPNIPENEIEKPPKNPASLAGEALYKFLSFAEVDTKAPDGYTKFSEFHERNMILQRQFITEAYLRHLYVIYQSVPEKDQRAVIPGLEDEIRRHLELEKRNDEILTGIAIQLRIIRGEIEKYEATRDESMPILYSQLLTLFLQSQEDLASTIKSKLQDFILQKTVFSEFLQEYFYKLNIFISPIAEYAIRGVSCCLHSFFLQQITLNEFRAQYPMLKRCDQLLQNIPEQGIEQICVSSSPARMRHLFKTRQLFVFSIYAAQKAMFVELPLEALRQLSLAVKYVKKMFELEIGGKPTEEESQSLFNFVLLKSENPNLFSLGKYLQHFLVGLPLKDETLFTNAMDETLKYYENHLTTLDSYLSDF
ncbi:hypothetical protein TRFO_25191 [Tritrichomonas foetus]|uniref:Uncharacterized protein n=1 Tax=Tritrichomonas foetus TaxID=1144522 RepID=A0A1J4K5J1_9EUKA|nr:hypothetical protein TRFO_25191 [Tritrichomonas foetus]|eukprot:OHT06663.1 hypothetical protein TRFO_25191 [Tritrichomonas foetus]